MKRKRQFKTQDLMKLIYDMIKFSWNQKIKALLKIQCKIQILIQSILTSITSSV